MTFIKSLICLGLSMKEAREQSLDCIKKLDFMPKKNSKVDVLSGGMKRKLHLDR